MKVEYLVEKVLKLDRYESCYFYQLSQQKCKTIWGELKWMLTKRFQVKFEFIVDEELIWRLTISWYWNRTDMNHSQQNSYSILGELKRRLTKPFQVKFGSIVDMELIWRLTISWYWNWTDMNHVIIFIFWVSKNLNLFQGS